MWIICRDHLTGAQKLAAEGSVVLGGMSSSLPPITSYLSGYLPLK